VFPSNRLRKEGKSLATGSDNSWLAVDVGNSQIKVGIFAASPDQEAPRSDQVSLPSLNDHRLPVCPGSYSVPLDETVPWNEIFNGQSVPAGLRCVIVGSNQHGVDRIVNGWPNWLSQPDVIRSSESFPISIQVDEPRRVGLDRLLNAVAANMIRDTQSPVIIVSCGTATTIDLVSAAGCFCGGAILPGFTLCARALHQYTEVLPFISMDELFDLPPSEDCHPALGSNTQAAIMSGVFWGQIGAVRELIARLSQSGLAGNKSTAAPKVLLTGGGSRLLVPYFPDAVHCPYLSLQGLVLAAAAKKANQ
jgi:type III pantothenate kinase